MLEETPDIRQYNTTTKFENIKEIQAIGQIKKFYINFTSINKYVINHYYYLISIS
jgi:hypothetical protein